MTLTEYFFPDIVNSSGLIFCQFHYLLKKVIVDLGLLYIFFRFFPLMVSICVISDYCCQQILVLLPLNLKWVW